MKKKNVDNFLAECPACLSRFGYTDDERESGDGCVMCPECEKYIDLNECNKYTR